MKRRSIAVAAALLLSLSAPAFGQDAQAGTQTKPESVALMEGLFAGTFLCSAGEMGMTLSLEDLGPDDSADSGSGTVMRRVKGVLNFFPIVGNPDAPRGAFEMEGTATLYEDFAAVIELEPGAWLDKPEHWGASGLKATISRTGTVFGEPTASDCYALRMARLITQ